MSEEVEVMSSKKAVKSFIKKRLLAISKYPDGWGSPLAVELQVILLVEMWHVSRKRTDYFVYDTNSRYIKFIAQDDRVPGPNNLTLTHRLELDNSSNEIFTEVLMDFAKKEGVIK